MRYIINKLAFYVVILAMTATACGYHLVGTSNKLPKHIRTLAIPVFTNLTDQPELHRNLTDAVRQAFLNDARVRIVPERKADLVVKGTLSFYDVRPIAFNDQDVATQYWVKISIDLDAVDRVKKKNYLKQKLKTRWDYNVNESVVDSEEARLQGLEEAYEDLALRMVSLFLDPF